jgi:hypothetical protein
MDDVEHEAMRIAVAGRGLACFKITTDMHIGLSDMAALCFCLGMPPAWYACKNSQCQ